MSSQVRALPLRTQSFNVDSQKSSIAPTNIPNDKSFQFICNSHNSKPIIFICTSKDSQNNLLCADCVLENPSFLVRYKEQIYSIQDYIEGSKNKIFQVKVEKEFQGLRKRVSELLDGTKGDIKKAFSVSNSFEESDNFDLLEKKFVDAFLGKSTEDNNNVLDKFDKENVQKFVKDANRYEEMEKRGYELGTYRGASALETRYFELLAKIKSQTDSYCKSVQKLTQSFVDIAKEMENVSTHRDTVDARRHVPPVVDISLTSDNAPKKKSNMPLDTSYSNNNISHNRSMSINHDESYLASDVRYSIRETSSKQNQLKSLLTNFSKTNNANEIINHSSHSNHVNTSYSLPKTVPKPGVKPLKEFPTSFNPAIKEALSKHGPFRYDIHGGPSETDYGKRQKYGAMQLENGDIYEGEWNDEKREGYGKLLSVGGFFFDGFWKNNLAHGRGRLININGDMYDGEWANGKYHGRGTFIGANGYQYTGDWTQDMQHGHGSEYWPDGSSYEGEYKLSKKHGKGVFKWANGEKYTGEFSNNNMHGNGIYEWPNGQRYYGQWSENKIAGEGKLESPKPGNKMGDWEKRVLLSPDCALFKHGGKSRVDEDLTVDPRYKNSLY